MPRAANDAALNKAGDIYRYLIALRDCFELDYGDTLQIQLFLPVCRYFTRKRFYETA